MKSGATITEYAILIALGLGVSVFVMDGLTTTVSGRMTQASASFNTNGTSAGSTVGTGHHVGCGTDATRFLRNFLVDNTGRVDRHDRHLWSDGQHGGGHVRRHFVQHGPDHRVYDWIDRVDPASHIRNVFGIEFRNYLRNVIWDVRHRRFNRTSGRSVYSSERKAEE